MQISDTTVYYFFSTSAQSIAGVAGLLSAFLVLRYQSMISDISKKYRHIAKGFGASGPFLECIFNGEEQVTYQDFVTDKQRVEWVNTKFSKFWREGDFSNFKKIWLENNPSIPQDADYFDQKSRDLMSWKLEIEHLNGCVSAAQTLKSRALIITAVGLLLVMIALIGTILPDMITGNANHKSSDWALYLTVFGVSVAFYFSGVIYMTAIAFRES